MEKHNRSQVCASVRCSIYKNAHTPTCTPTEERLEKNVNGVCSFAVVQSNVLLIFIFFKTSVLKCSTVFSSVPMAVTYYKNKHF